MSNDFSPTGFTNQCVDGLDKTQLILSKLIKWTCSLMMNHAFNVDGFIGNGNNYFSLNSQLWVVKVSHGFPNFQSGRELFSLTCHDQSLAIR